MLANFSEEIVSKIKSGGIGIIPTDTLYGLVGRAQDREVVERLREVRGREEGKPLIVLISKVEDLALFGVEVDASVRSILEKVWPGAVSAILSVTDKDWQYLTRGTGTIAFRLPKDESLRELLSQTGPLVAPSVNTPGEKPAETIDEAKKYFPNLDFYVDAGKITSEPSTLIGFENGKVKVYRQGIAEIPKELHIF